ncbi:unnamed protein product [Rotaria sordida]|uniref:Uncharacterized protein n=1 Tax=Rotaria sordida TaxID=392033 RepID=A0A814CID6_9BILA|nr:unnamed protein product [Rotaria sordida]CAF0940530.1 unnamed protein product [Rotaria sordida]
MSNKYYLLSITFLLFVCFAQSQNETSSVTDGTTVAELTTPESVISRLPTPWMSSDTLPTTTNLMLPSFTGKMEDPTATSVLTMSSNTVPTFTTNPDVTHPSATNYSSSINLITSLTSIISTGITSTAPTTVLSGPSPGVPAQLGMGLGISLFGVLLIAEIILFARILG